MYRRTIFLKAKKKSLLELLIKLDLNQNMNMTDPSAPETITVPKDADGVSCDGGHGALGHPRVWYSFDGQDQVECGYCDRLFVRSA